MVNKDVLLYELFSYGLKDLKHQLFRSYLENRLKYVTMNSTNSSSLPIGIGVPQGST